MNTATPAIHNLARRLIALEAACSGAEGQLVEALPILQPCEALSINTLDELAAVEAEMGRLGYSH